MAEFKQTRDELRRGRDAAEKARLNWFASGQRIKILQNQLNALERQKGDNNELYLNRRRKITEQINAEEKTKESQVTVFERLRTTIGNLEKDFSLFVDPREALSEHFPADTPFLLFPMRLETRFKTINNQPQLWVRVYPDDCMVDSFEPLLSVKEVNNAARFWAEYYSAGKSVTTVPDPVTLDLQKAAWRLLVGAVGDGRAAWITRQLIPDESTSFFPVRGPNTIILAIVSGAWNAVDKTAITELFKNLWLADGNDEGVKKIRADFDIDHAPLTAATVIEDFQPVNFSDSLPLGLKRADADLQVAVVAFNDLDRKAGKERGWSQATQVNILPERLALLRFIGSRQLDPVFGNVIPFPLPTSPDPSPDAAKQFEQVDGDLKFAEEIKWVADFDTAVAIGMGFRVNLTPDETNGYTRLMVLGVKLSADIIEGKRELETLFDHHYFSKKGLHMLAQGTPTNNSATADAGYKSGDDADATFDLYFNKNAGFDETDDSTKRKDGQWLAEWLGLDYAVTKKLLHSDGSDQMDARNMNMALWPATLGYMMESMMKGGFSPEVIAQTRDFFNAFVSGRGPVPAIRIGNQPYGILPTSAFRRQKWMQTEKRFLVFKNQQFAFLNELYQLLLRIDNNWNTTLAGGVAHVAQDTSKPYQTLLDIIALHPNSAEYHRRYLESLIEMSNTMSMQKSGFREHSDVANKNTEFLRSNLGYTSPVMPQVAALLGLPWQDPVKHLIDDQPLSETAQVRNYTADSKNYITALLEQARKSHDAVRTGAGLSERPDAELYRLLKYALEQAYHSSGIAAAAAVNAIPAEKMTALAVEQPFIQQQFGGAVTESRYALLYGKITAVSTTKTIGEFVRESLLQVNIPAFSKYLSTMLAALDQLQHATTAQLERTLVEHLDCCSYRLDGWKTGLLTSGLGFLRNNQGSVKDQQRRTGIYIGSFGWLENVHPNTAKKISPAVLPQDLIEDFNATGDKTFLTDTANEGYIHAPSLNQGVTAAILRNGYISHGKPDANNVLSVDLSSKRIRLALSVIEGIQGGQPLAALLGYHFERELHDRSDLTDKGIDLYIYAIRKIFPLNSDKIKDTKVSNTADPSVDEEKVPVTAIEARNVVDGISLTNHVKKQTEPANKLFPFGLSIDNPDPVVGKAITDAVVHILDIADAIADLGMAESVHHIVMGNTDRAAGVLESFSKGNYPQEPDVTHTPRSGATLTHRVGIQLEYTPLAPADGPRGSTEPSINKWLATMLPPMNSIICQCTYTSVATGAVQTIPVSMASLGLQPIDLLYLSHTQNGKSQNEIDDRLMHYLFTSTNPAIDKDVIFAYTEDAAPGSFSLFQLMPLIKSLRVLILESAKLTPGDLALTNEASKKDAPVPELPVQRVIDLVASLRTELTDADTAPSGILFYLRTLPPADVATPAELDKIRMEADATIESLVILLLTLARFGIPQTAVGSLYTQRQQWFARLKDKLRELIARWQTKLDAYTLLAGNPDTVDNLQAMERLVSVTQIPEGTITSALVAAKKDLFKAAFDAVNLIVTTRQGKLADLLSAINTFDPTPFDLVTLDLTTILRQIPQFIYDQQSRVAALAMEIKTKRLASADTILLGFAALSPSDQVVQLESAARLILGDAFSMFPKYIIPPAQKSEITNSWNAKDALLNHSIAGGRTHPTEDWLHGIARVHDKMKHLENCILMRDAFDMTETDFVMRPMQFPFSSSEYHWLALPFPTDKVNLEKSNALLYTSFAKDSVNPLPDICGILADEWTELIPATEETTGITFHYDRPNAEAPQTLLLVTPTEFSGNWQWVDLVDALTYSLDAARARGIEPDKIDNTHFAPFLPAVFGAESLYPYSIVMDNRAHYMTEEAVKNIGLNIK